MFERARNIFPGGNTPQGFFSYYKYILPQNKAERIFCIKGGPGVGKSTLMKQIGSHFLESGEHVDIFRCSADPDSLDGILLRDRNVAIVDGTAPHVIDPLNPGAVDEIIDLAQFLDNKKLMMHKNEIIKCSSNVSEAFNEAYHLLKLIGQEYDYLYSSDEIAQIKDNRCDGTVKRYFSYAITYKGIVDFTDSLLNGISNVYTIDSNKGAKTEADLIPLANKLIDGGFDVELYYSPMLPEKRIEHIVSLDADVAIISNDRGNCYQKSNGLKEVFNSLNKAKLLHDELESYYLSAMNFEKVDETVFNIIKRIENEY